MSQAPIEFPIGGLTDGEVRLRLASDADVPAVVEACRDPEIARWTKVPDDYTADDAREWLDRQAGDRSSGAGLHLVIADEPTARLVGSIGFTGFDWEDRRASIGYWVAADSRRRGIAVHAVRLLAAWGFEELGLGRVEIKTRPENAASQRVAERAGFAREGLLRSYAVIKGRRRDMVIFSLLPGDQSLA